MTPPLVSVILPVFNRLPYLRASVDSVFAQTVAEWELIIADDGSDEETQAYLHTLEALARVKLIHLVHSGNPSAVRNAALREARGRYVAFLDSDDVWLPQKSEAQLAAHEACPGRLWSYTGLMRMAEDGKILDDWPKNRWVPSQGSIFAQLLTLEAFVATPCVIAERRLVEQAGGFDEEQLFFEEYDLWLRLSQLSDVIVIDEPLALVRNHLQHYTADRVGVYEARFRLLDKVATLATTRQLASVLRLERARNASNLAPVAAAAGYRTKALHMLWRSRACAWHQRTWWRLACSTVVQALAPSWLRRVVRRYRQEHSLSSM